MLRFDKVENREPFGENKVLGGNPYHFEIFNDKDEKIGRIFRTRVGRFMHWAFFPDECDGFDLFYTNGCLKEIREFITKCYLSPTLCTKCGQEKSEHDEADGHFQCPDIEEHSEFQLLEHSEPNCRHCGRLEKQHNLDEIADRIKSCNNFVPQKSVQNGCGKEDDVGYSPPLICGDGWLCPKCSNPEQDAPEEEGK